MQGRRWLLRTAIALLGAFLFVGTALAHTVSYNTRLTLDRRPVGVISKGTVVTFFGKLQSVKDRCESNSVVKLVKIGTGVVARDRTGLRGGYSFVRTINNTARWKTRFDGKVLNAVHPHDHTCDASQSDPIRVRVA